MSRRDWIKKELGVLEARASVLIPLACAGLYLYQFWHVWKYAVNLPYWDEWEVFKPDGLPAGFSLRWLFEQHNEHRLVTTKLLIWLLYRLDGWDIHLHQLINFAVYGLLVAALVWGARKAAPEMPAWVHFAFAIFLLTTISIENHLMAYQSQVHFWLLFFLAAAYLLFDAGQRWPRLLWGCAAASLSTYSLAAGVVSGGVLLACYALFKSLRAAAAEGGGRGRELLQLLLVLALVGAPIALWPVGYKRPTGGHALVFAGAEFWDYYLNVVGFNFGVDGVNAWAGAVFLLIVVAPVCVLALREGRALPAGLWAVCSVVLACLVVFASIAAGRAAIGPLQAKSSRYAEFGMALVPLSALLWGRVLRGRRGLRAAVLCGLWLLLFATFRDNWRYGDYLYRRAERVELGAKCVERYYLKGGDGLCPRINPFPIASRLDAARELNASFYRELSLLTRGGGG